jgi:hypothetical protein
MATGNLDGFVASYERCYANDMEALQGGAEPSRKRTATVATQPAGSPVRPVRARQAAHGLVSSAPFVPLPAGGAEPVDPATLLTHTQAAELLGRVSGARRMGLEGAVDDAARAIVVLDVDAATDGQEVADGASQPAALVQLPAPDAASAPAAGAADAPADTLLRVPEHLDRRAVSALAGADTSRITCFSWRLTLERMSAFKSAITKFERGGRTHWQHFVDTLTALAKDGHAFFRGSHENGRIVNVYAWVQMPLQRKWMMENASDVYVIDDTHNLMPGGIKCFVVVAPDASTRVGLPIAFGYLLTNTKRRGVNPDRSKSQFIAEGLMWLHARRRIRPLVTLFDRDHASLAGYREYSKVVFRFFKTRELATLETALRSVAEHATPAQVDAAARFRARVDAHIPCTFADLLQEYPQLATTAVPLVGGPALVAESLFDADIVREYATMLPGLAHMCLNVLQACTKAAETWQASVDADPNGLRRAFASWRSIAHVFAATSVAAPVTQQLTQPVVLLCQWHVARAVSTQVWQKLGGARTTHKDLFPRIMRLFKDAMHSPTEAGFDDAWGALTSTCREHGAGAVLAYLRETWFCQPWNCMWAAYGRPVARCGQNVTTLAESSHSMCKRARPPTRNAVYVMRVLHGLPDYGSPRTFSCTLPLINRIEKRRCDVTSGASRAARAADPNRHWPRIRKWLEWAIDDLSTRVQHMDDTSAMYNVLARSARVESGSDAAAASARSAAAAAGADDEPDGLVEDDTALDVGRELDGAAGGAPAVVAAPADAAAHDEPHYYTVDLRGTGMCTCPAARLVPVGGAVLCVHIHGLRVLHELKYGRDVVWEDQDTLFMATGGHTDDLARLGLVDGGSRASKAAVLSPPPPRPAAGAAGTGAAAADLLQHRDTLVVFREQLSAMAAWADQMLASDGQPLPARVAAALPRMAERVGAAWRHYAGLQDVRIGPAPPTRRDPRGSRTRMGTNARRTGRAAGAAPQPAAPAAHATGAGSAPAAPRATGKRPRAASGGT